MPGKSGYRRSGFGPIFTCPDSVLDQELTEGNKRVHRSSSEPKICICSSEAVDSNCWFCC
jgi:hypothetical protein